MMFRRRRSYRSLLLAMAVLFLIGGTAHAAPADYEDHWARPALDELARAGIVTADPDTPVSRAEFEEMCGQFLGLGSPSDETIPGAARQEGSRALDGTEGGYDSKATRSDLPLTRAEMVAALGRSLQLGSTTFGQDWAPTYSDVPRSHPAFRLVELATRVDCLPPAYGPSFLPGAAATRAEAAWMLSKIKGLERGHGAAIEVNPEAGTITILPAGGAETRTIQVDPDALLIRNKSTAVLGQIRANDQAAIVIGQDSQAKVVEATGRVNISDLFSRLSGLTGGIVNPANVAAIANGNWNEILGGLRDAIFDRLLQLGLGPGEAQSLLERDWMTLDLLNRDRLVAILSTRLGLSPDLAAALLDRDLAQAKNLLRSGATGMALERLLGGAG